MVNPALSTYALFMAAFSELRQKVNNRPANIARFLKDSVGIRTLVDRLVVLTHNFDEALALSPSKYSPQVPSQFPDEYQDYKERFEGPVMDAYFDNLIGGVLDFIAADDSGSTPSSASAPFRDTVSKPDPREDEDFLPHMHEPSAALGYMLDYCADKMFAYEDDTEDLMANSLRLGLHAWDYLERVVGIDVANIARRWRMVPHIFVPKHVSEKHGIAERQSLYRLLDDAVRAFVFGAPTAATAMCRATCELVLKEHYGLEIVDADGNDLPLMKIVFAAEKRYGWIQRLRLKDNVRRANSVLHAHGRSSSDLLHDERIVVEFLTTVKALIERAPPKIATV